MSPLTLDAYPSGEAQLGALMFAFQKAQLLASNEDVAPVISGIATANVETTVSPVGLSWTATLSLPVQDMSADPTDGSQDSLFKAAISDT